MPLIPPPTQRQTLSCESLCACWPPRWAGPHARGLRLEELRSLTQSYLRELTVGSQVSPGPLPPHSHACSHSPHRVLLHRVDFGSVCRSLAWLWNLPPLPAAQAATSSCSGFLNTKRSIRAFGTPQKGAKSLYHPQEPFFFFFLCNGQ